MIPASGFPEALVVVFPWLQQKSWIRTYPCSLSQCHYLLYTLFKCNPNIRGRGMMLVLPGQRLSSEVSKSVLIFSVLPAILMLSTYTDRNSPSARLTNRLSQYKTFPNCVPIELSQIAFPTIVLPEDGRTNSFREERLDHPYWTMILAICALVDVSKYPGVLTLEFEITLMHLPFWPAYKRILHQLLDLNILEIWT